MKVIKVSKNLDLEQVKLMALLNENIPNKKHSITLNTKDVSSLIGVSPSTIENWRKQAVGIEFIEANGRILYRKDKVVEFLLNHETKCL